MSPPVGRAHKTCHHNTYGLTCADYDELLAFARNRCQICRAPSAETPRGLLVIDHDHRYGEYAVRGLLCDGCNKLMEHVDAGRKHDPRAYFYCRNAWFVKRMKRLREEALAVRREQNNRK